MADKILGGLASTTRNININGSAPSSLSDVDYLEFATKGNSADFGDLATYRRGDAGTSNATRGLVGGGYPGTPGRINNVDYFTIATIGNGTDFGDSSANLSDQCAVSSTTRAVYAGGRDDPNAYINTIEYFTIGSTGNGTDFGDFLQLQDGLQVEITGSNTRGYLFAGGGPCSRLFNQMF